MHLVAQIRMNGTNSGGTSVCNAKLGIDFAIEYALQQGNNQ